MTVMIGIVLLTVMLGVILKHYKSRWFHPSGAGLLLGIAVGCFVFISLELSYETMPENMRYSIKAFAQCMRFDTKFFFLVLLPWPLIFEGVHPASDCVFSKTPTPSPSSPFWVRSRARFQRAFWCICVVFSVFRTVFR